MYDLLMLLTWAELYESGMPDSESFCKFWDLADEFSFESSNLFSFLNPKELDSKVLQTKLQGQIVM